VFAPSEPDLAHVRTVAGDFEETGLAEACDQPSIVGDIVLNWCAKGEDRPTLCYAVNRAHAKHLAERFDEAGGSVAYIDAYTESSDREKIFVGFRAGAIRIIVNIGTLTTGIDLPMASCLILGRPTKSRILYVQMFGRGLRAAPGKTDLLVFDHGGSTLRLGLPREIGQDRLDDGREKQSSSTKDREKPGPLPKLCSECKAIVPRHLNACECCGTPVRTGTDVLSVDGELVELGSLRTGSRGAEIGEKARFHGELLWLSRERGYSQGWAAHKYRERFGVWPNDPRIRSAPASEPSLQTRNWLKSRQIAFAKRRRAG
jgi:DNA repair protein RadD